MTDMEMAEEFIAQLEPKLLLLSPPTLIRAQRKSSVRPEVAMLGQALRDAGIANFNSSSVGILVISVPDLEWSRAVGDCCIKHGLMLDIQGPTRYVMQRVVKGADIRAFCADAMASEMPAILIEVDGDGHIPDDVLRAASLRIVVKPLSWQSCQTVAARMTSDGRRIYMTEPDNLARLSPHSWMLAYRHEQDAEEMLKSVVAIAGPAKARDGIPTLRLADCPGMGDAGTWGSEIADDLRAYVAGDLSWSEIDRGALLYGPPGCGKTRFAACLAGSAGLPFIATSSSEWSVAKGGNMAEYLTAMQDAFTRARACAPSLLFIDEIDAVGIRGQGGHNATWTSGVVAGLLELMDGSDRREGVVVIAATNLLDSVDPALRRSGRLDRCIEVGMPTADALRHILQVHLGNDLADEGLDDVAAQAAGGTGADVERWVREARRKARVARRPMKMSDLVAVVKPASTKAVIGFGR